MSDKDQEVVQRMQRVMAEIETIIGTLLMLAREEDVHSDTPVSINQVLAEELELLSELAEAQRNQVTMVENAETTCNAKASVMAIIVSNLLRNALTFTNGGTVTVEVFDTYFVIRDTGIGMSEEDANNAFTAFYRGQAAQAERPGQGLGLALVRRLTQQLGWRVSIDSVLGEGTDVTVRFQDQAL